MFTGLVEEMGTVTDLKDSMDSLRIKIRCTKVLKDAKVGDSIATNGVCLTAVEIGSDYFVADVMHETVKRTNLNKLKAGTKVNLEKSLTLSSPLGGHLVTGDVDTTGIIINTRRDGIAIIYRISIPYRYAKYLVEKGRVTLDGTSLTISDFGKDWVEVSLIPHTQKEVVLGEKRPGDSINIEFDLIGKYVERMLGFAQPEKKESLTMDKLGRYGFL